MNATSPAGSLRVRAANRVALRPDGAYVLYWMVAARRTTSNFALQHALGLARELRRPLVVLEALRRGYPWRSERIDGFVVAAMADHAARFARAGVRYHAYVERRDGDGKGLLEAFTARACAVVTDDFPAFFLPRMVAAAAARVRVRVDVVDSNGLLPLAATTSEFRTAFAFRRFLQATLPAHLREPPLADPLDGIRLPRPPRLAADVLARWPAADLPAPSRAAETALDRFVTRRLAGYAAHRDDPDDDATSGLSAHLHFGHVGAHDVFRRVTDAEGWTPRSLARTTSGKRTGWWGVSPAAEAFLDQFVTWRELGFVFAHHRDDHDRYESLPDWAQRTLADHAGDPRPVVHELDALDAAATDDPLWNAAQTQLVREGRIHNSLRMLWGKKILQWSASPRDALAAMIELNNRHALDGRDPNSYSGIFWVLGRFDRPWGPERPIFGKIRYMTSANAARKLRVREYLRRFASAGVPAAPRSRKRRQR
jgi:deoxyribodipyrimidine photo-lyase